MDIYKIIGDPKVNAEELLKIAKYRTYMINNSLEALIALDSSPFIISYNVKDIDLKKKICKGLETYDKSYKNKSLFEVIPLWILNENVQIQGPKILRDYSNNMEILCYYLLHYIKISNNRLDESITKEILKVLHHIEENSFINYKQDSKLVYESARAWMDKYLLRTFHLSNN